jgi:hypothetical protein
MIAPEPFGKIVVDGRLHLGSSHDLVQSARRPNDDEKVRLVLGGHSADFDSYAPQEGEAIGEVLEYDLSDRSTDELFISGQGMVTSFGIFGAPGSGKTVLLMHLLRQILNHANDDPDRRFGALILDPKAALIEDVKEICSKAGRLEDLVVINTDLLNRSTDAAEDHVNLIDCTVDAQELGALLVLAGRSAGVDARDPFWFQEWTNLFACSLSILRADAWMRTGLLGPPPVTLRQLVSAILDLDSATVKEEKPLRQIQRIAAEVVANTAKLPEGLREDVVIDKQALDRFYMQNYAGTIEAFVTRAFGAFRRSRLACYSAEWRLAGRKPFYEDIVEHGRIVLVSISPAEPALAKTLCTLIKCLFQRTVLSRGELLASGAVGNRTRPLLIACDEYSEIASEVPGQAMGDGQFLALARQFGCMALLATQSVNVLEASSLGETWRSVFGNFAAKIYMRLADIETAEAASKLAGESDWRIVSRSHSVGAGGASAGRSRELRERPNLPPAILTQVLRTGEGVVIGSLDGGATRPAVRFLRVPFFEQG